MIGVEETWAELGTFIKAQRDAAQMSVRRLAELAGVSNPYLSQIERGLRKPSADILQQLARALRISAETLYVRAGILDPEGTIDRSVVDAISIDPHLTSEQRKSLITIYESFRAQNAATSAPTAVVDAQPPPPPPAAPPPAAASDDAPPSRSGANGGARRESARTRKR